MNMVALAPIRILTLQRRISFTGFTGDLAPHASPPPEFNSCGGVFLTLASENHMQRTTKIRLGVASGILLSTIALLLSCSESIVNRIAFHPTKGSVVDIENLPPSIKHIFLESSDGESISTFYLSNPKADKTILYFHGNAGNASQRLPLARDLTELNSNVLLVDYRGYGLSSGEPSEKGMYLDSRAALRFLVDELNMDLSELFVYGRSIGSAAAVDLVKGHNVAGLILVTPISSGRELAEMAGMENIASIVSDPFNNVDKLGLYQGPVLIIHGNDDEVLPVEMGRRLWKMRASRARYLEIPHAGHNNIINIDRSNFYGSIRQFCDDVLSGAL